MAKSKVRKKAKRKANREKVHRTTIGGNFMKLNAEGVLCVYNGKRFIREATQEERDKLGLDEVV